MTSFFSNRINSRMRAAWPVLPVLALLAAAVAVVASSLPGADRAGSLNTGSFPAGNTATGTPGLDTLRPEIAPPRASITLKPVSLPKRLPGNIRAITQDRKGFIWLGTDNGLYRFDGHRLRSYNHRPGSGATPVDNRITDLQMLGDGRMIVGTRGGLSVYDPQRDNFRHFTHDRDDEESLPSNRVRTLYMDFDSRIWVGTDRGLTLLDVDSGEIRNFQTGTGEVDPGTPELQEPGDPESQAPVDEPDATSPGSGEDAGTGNAAVSGLDDDRFALSDPRVTAIGITEAGSIWIGTETGLDLYHAGSDAFFRITFYEQDTPLSNVQVTDIHAVHDSREAIWVGTRNHGLFRFHPAEGQTERYAHRPDEPGSLSSNRVADLITDTHGHLWVATGRGLDRLEPDGRFRTYSRIAGSGRAQERSQVHALYLDRHDNLWAGTHPSELWRADLKPTGFRSFFTEYPDTVSQSVRALHRYPDELYWIGTDQGVIAYNMQTDELQPVSSETGSPAGLQQARVNGITHDSSGDLWFGTGESGLFRYVSQTDEFLRYHARGEGARQLDRGAIHAVNATPEDRIWLATDRGAGILAPDDGRPAVFPETLDGVPVYALHQDELGSWFGTAEGLFRLGPDGREIHRQPVPLQGGLTAGEIRSINRDQSGVYWLATPNGLIRYDVQAGEAVRLTSDHGLPGRHINEVVQDHRGDLWVASRSGLSRLTPEHPDTADRFRPEELSVRNYRFDDGLPVSVFQSGAGMRTGQNELLFGGRDGMAVFHPERLVDSPHAPPPRLLAIHYRSDEQTIERAAPFEEAPLIPRGTESPGISYFTPEFTRPEEQRIAWRLVPQDGDDQPDWNEEPAGGYLDLGNPDPGSYTLQVRAANHHGVWSETHASLPLSVESPLMAPFWWYVLATVGVVGLLALIAWLSRKTTQMESRLLEYRVRSHKRKTSEQDEIFDLITRHTSELIGLLDERGKIIYMSPASSHLLGYEHTDLLGKNLVEYLHPQDIVTLRTSLERLKEHRQSVSIRLHLLHRDDHWHFLDCTVSLVEVSERRLAHHIHFVLVGRPAEKAGQANEQAGVQAGKPGTGHDRPAPATRSTGAGSPDEQVVAGGAGSMEQNGILPLHLAGLGSLLRAPVHSLMAHARLLTRHPEIPRQQRHYAELMLRSSRHLEQLIGRLAELGRLESGKPLLQEHDFDLRELLQDLADEMHVKCKEKELTFECHFSSRLPRYGCADAQRLRLILSELLENAIRYTHRGRIRFTADMEQPPDHSLSHPAIPLRFQVQDTGMGIEEDDRNRIFQPFQILTDQAGGRSDEEPENRTGAPEPVNGGKPAGSKAEDTPSSASGDTSQPDSGDSSSNADSKRIRGGLPPRGAGIGLALVSRLAGAMGGDIRVESRAGEGSTFTLTLTLRAARSPVSHDEQEMKRIVRFLQQLPDSSRQRIQDAIRDGDLDTLYALTGNLPQTNAAVRLLRQKSSQYEFDYFSWLARFLDREPQ